MKTRQYFILGAILSYVLSFFFFQFWFSAFAILLLGLWFGYAIGDRLL